MRLICPGCGAQYEVDDGIIPDAGRDVQCSACGHVWFQKSRPMLLSGEEVVTVLSPVAELRAGVEPPRPPLSSSDAVDQVMSSAFDEDPDPELHPAPAVRPRRALDDSLLAILREEAEREARARRADGPALETQQEMNLAEVPPPAVSAPVTEPMAEPAAEQAVARPAPVAAPEPVKPLPLPEPLPDIGALKASLRASADRHDAAALEAILPAPRRAGFRAGFLSVLLIAALATAVYGFAPALSAAVPDLHPAIAAYVERVDLGRVWLDQHLRGVISAAQTALRG